MKIIYYADDDLDDLNIFQDAIQGSGYTVVVFFSGSELVETLLSSNKKPEIIFLDIRMPGIPGNEILRAIRMHNECADIPVVLVTGMLAENQIQNYIDDGANYMMQKSSSLLSFKDKINEVLHKDLSMYVPLAAEFLAP